MTDSNSKGEFPSMRKKRNDILFPDIKLSKLTKKHNAIPLKNKDELSKAQVTKKSSSTNLKSQLSQITHIKKSHKDKIQMNSKLSEYADTPISQNNALLPV